MNNNMCLNRITEQIVVRFYERGGSMIVTVYQRHGLKWSLYFN